ncbi:signal peptidase II [Sansalvadorimonas sp. 2012CJ34-2]|uniref:Lipoprotein signal peptidase n=1 Tax=Parendozoicomonas callyspongiae TaxID=2942213 RepID=A0ABT0PDX9_9GAMM|nr:signal peptidase II [Sansalvadorimonas sp. 2012CJ34-2]MCL6269481.1 signal peptidase II [Sansalvadorimonas sp. 2012CJ34-2]
MIRSKPLFWSGLGVSLLIIVADQLSKHWFLGNFSLYEQFVVIPDFFSLTLAFNKGAAFSFLSDAGGWQKWFFIGVAAAVSIMLLGWMSRLSEQQKMQAAAFALILGGAVGNVIDRVALGHVVDFLLFHYKTSWYFPAFNLADIAITVGAGLMILDMLIHPEANKK